jgi:hypothetical protein
MDAGDRIRYSYPQNNRRAGDLMLKKFNAAHLCLLIYELIG